MSRLAGRACEDSVNSVRIIITMVDSGGNEYQSDIDLVGNPDSRASLSLDYAVPGGDSFDVTMKIVNVAARLIGEPNAPTRPSPTRAA